MPKIHKFTNSARHTVSRLAAQCGRTASLGRLAPRRRVDAPTQLPWYYRCCAQTVPGRAQHRGSAGHQQKSAGASYGRYVAQCRALLAYSPGTVAACRSGWACGYDAAHSCEACAGARRMAICLRLVLALPCCAERRRRKVGLVALADVSTVCRALCLVCPRLKRSPAQLAAAAECELLLSSVESLTKRHNDLKCAPCSSAPSLCAGLLAQPRTQNDAVAHKPPTAI